MLEVFGINKHQWIAHWQAYRDVKYLEDMKGKKKSLKVMPEKVAALKDSEIENPSNNSMTIRATYPLPFQAVQAPKILHACPCEHLPVLFGCPFTPGLPAESKTWLMKAGPSPCCMQAYGNDFLAFPRCNCNQSPRNEDFTSSLLVP